MPRLLLSFLFSCIVLNEHANGSSFFNVVDYGADGNGQADSTQAILRAWSNGCDGGDGGTSRVWVPPGVYLLDSVRLTGPCRGPMEFLVEGTLVAPTNPDWFFTDTWISFRYVDGLTLNGAGSGVLDGQGEVAWKYNDCQVNQECRSLPISLRLDFVTNSSVKGLTSIDSKNGHMNIFACHNVNISNVFLSAPAHSPNTDGIRIGTSTHIRISNTTIKTGDDCIAMVSGSQDIDISDVACGPGHGISIGSLGRGHDSEYVRRITVRNSSFVGADNGLRIKTWNPSSYSLASNISFENVVMNQTRNPIFIDQKYCPTDSCKMEGEESSSSVEIRDVTFKNITGSSSSQIAVKMQCSETTPCRNVQLIDINLKYDDEGGEVTAQCSNVFGSSSGKQMPDGCI